MSNDEPTIEWKVQCSDCRFYEPTDMTDLPAHIPTQEKMRLLNSGGCRYNPPVVYITHQYGVPGNMSLNQMAKQAPVVVGEVASVLWPTVHRTWWCGKFELDKSGGVQ